MKAKHSARKLSRDTESIDNKAWIDQELKGCLFKDVRLAKRFGKLIDHMSQRLGSSIPFACQDWAATKAA